MIRFGSNFLDMTPEAQATREKIDKKNFIKVKNFCAKDPINRMKRKPTEWEKIFANHISYKGLLSRCIKKSYNSTTNSPIFKMCKGLE